MDLTEIRNVVLLNCIALVYVTLTCISFMPQNLHFIEVCSASTYLPFKKLNVYASTKVFVRSFFNGLRRKLSGSGMSVLEVFSGWVQMDFVMASARDRSVLTRVFRHTVSREGVVAKVMTNLRRKRLMCEA